jgi:hypothetical protein
MLPIQLRQTDFQFGVLQIPYADVASAGIGVSRRKTGSFKSLLIAFRLPGDPKLRHINFGLDRSAEHAQFVETFRGRVVDRWKGEANHFAMRKALGLSNRRIFVIVAALVLLSLGITAALLSSAPRHASPRQLAPQSQPRPH